MNPKVASEFYRCIEPECGEERTFVVDRVRTQLARSIIPGKRVLDLGCGAGRFTFAAEEMGAIPVGIDCTAELIEHARKVARQRDSCATFVEGDYTQLSFEPASFDVALMMGNIVECSYDDADLLVSQLRVILAPGGLLCFDMPDYYIQCQQGTRSFLDYDPSTGMKESVYELPRGKKRLYQAYFWTVAFAKHICSRHLVLHEDERLDNGRYWLAFRNN